MAMRWPAFASLLAAASASEWKVYDHFDVPAADWNPEHKRLADGFFLTTASTYPLGPWPLNCMDLCFEDPSCHGFVLWQHECYFRGGTGQTTLQLVQSKVPREDMSLFVIFGEHPSAPDVGIPFAHLVLYASGAGLVFLVALVCLAYTIRNRKKASGTTFQEAPTPMIIAQKSSKHRGCDVGCLGKRTKVPNLV